VILPPENNFKTINNAWMGNLPISWQTHLPAVISSLNIFRKKYKFDKLHTSTKSGPNGQAMLTSFHDYLYLTDSQKENIIKLGGSCIEEKFNLINSDHDGISLMDHWQKTTGLEVRKTNSITRKLSTFGDHEGKTRVIGILDY
jgi:hypothetical protein